MIAKWISCTKVQYLLTIYFYRLNVTRKPFDNEKVRLALKLAIDNIKSLTDASNGDLPSKIAQWEKKIKIYDDAIQTNQWPSIKETQSFYKEIFDVFSKKTNTICNFANERNVSLVKQSSEEVLSKIYIKKTAGSTMHHSSNTLTLKQ